jgi:RimJ/RimL family protein N-acetyltransferase
MINPKFPVLKNKYVLLEPFKKKHITNRFVNSLNNEDINKYLVVRKKKQTKKTALKYYLNRLNNRDYYYAVIENKNRKLIGTITLRISGKNRAIIIRGFDGTQIPKGCGVMSYMICNKKYFGSLESKFSFQIFLDFSFNTLNLNKIYGGTEKNNISINFNLITNNFKLIQKNKYNFKFMLSKKNYKKRINYKIINDK